MGDVIHVGDGSVFFNKSTLTNAVVRASAGLRESDRDALTELTRVVEESGRPEATETLEAFLEEIGREKPRKLTLRALFAAIQESVPALNAMTDLAAKIADMIR